MSLGKLVQLRGGSVVAYTLEPEPPHYVDFKSGGCRSFEHGNPEENNQAAIDWLTSAGCVEIDREEIQ